MTALTPEQAGYLTRYSCPLCHAPHLSLADKKRHMRKVHPKAKKAKR